MNLKRLFLPEHKEELSVPLCDDGSPAEPDAGLLRLGGDSCQHEPDKHGVEDSAPDGLEEHEENGLGTPALGVATTVADGGLRLETEEEGVGEGGDVSEADCGVFGGCPEVTIHRVHWWVFADRFCVPSGDTDVQKTEDDIGEDVGAEEE